MEKLFMQRIGSVQQAKANPGEIGTKPSSDKLTQLEAELRNDTMKAKQEQNNQSAGGAQQPTNEQRRMQMKYDPQTQDYNLYGNQLGDFSTLLKQMTTDVEGGTNAMQLSTLESKKEIVRLEDANEQWDMITSQFGLTSRGDKVVKKAMKTNKLDGNSSWM